MRSTAGCWSSTGSSRRKYAARKPYVDPEVSVASSELHIDVDTIRKAYVTRIRKADRKPILENSFVTAIGSCQRKELCGAGSWMHCYSLMCSAESLPEWNVVAALLLAPAADNRR